MSIINSEKDVWQITNSRTPIHSPGKNVIFCLFDQIYSLQYNINLAAVSHNYLHHKNYKTWVVRMGPRKNVTSMSFNVLRVTMVMSYSSGSKHFRVCVSSNLNLNL